MRNKAEVKLVRDKYDTLGPLLLELDDIAGDARALLNIISTSEARLAVALAVVEGDDPDDDGGGKTVAA
jgi:hypothetical protein